MGMRNILTIAKNTLKLEIRDKIWIALLAFGLGYVAIMLFLSDLVLKELSMVRAFALLGIYFFNAVIALFLGTTSFYRDVERKTVYFILSKPVSRAQFLLGKFFGLCLVIFLTSVALAVAYLAVVALAGGGFDAMGLLAILMQFLEMALFLAFAIFVSTFSSSLLIHRLYIGRVLPRSCRFVARGGRAEDRPYGSTICFRKYFVLRFPQSRKIQYPRFCGA